MDEKGWAGPATERPGPHLESLSSCTAAAGAATIIPFQAAAGATQMAVPLRFFRSTMP
jgi:hypothetical protein